MFHFSIVPRTLIAVEGNDALAVVNNFFTNEISNLKSGQWREGFFPNVKGRIEAHGFVHVIESWVWIDVPAPESNLAHRIQQFVISEDASFAVVEQTAILCFEPSDVSNDLTDGLVNGLASALSDLSNSRQLPTRFCGCDAVVVYASLADVNAVVQSLSAAGGKERSAAALELDRIVAGQLQFGTDFDNRYFPQELGSVSQTVSFTKGCYLGQEPIARIDALGHVNRKVVKLVSTDDHGAENRAENGDLQSALPTSPFDLFEIGNGDREPISNTGNVSLKPVGQVTSVGCHDGFLHAIATVRTTVSKPGVVVGSSIGQFRVTR